MLLERSRDKGPLRDYVVSDKVGNGDHIHYSRLLSGKLRGTSGTER